MKQEITIQKEAGKIISGRDRLGKAVEALNDGFHVVTIEDKKNTRSLQQNAYYWACVVPMVYEGLREMGFTEIKIREHAHAVMMNLFLKVQMPDKDGLAIEFVKSTTELSTLEFGEYLEQIYQWASSYLGIFIPSPSSQSTFFYE